jgi:O-antigen/teichoic acid export membrane protein
MKIRGTSLVVKFLFTLFLAKFLGFEAVGFYGLITAASLIMPSFVGLALMHILSRRAVTQELEEITEALQYYGQYISCIYTILAGIAIFIGIWTENIVLTSLILLVFLFEHLNMALYQLLLNLSRPLVANILHFIRTAIWMIIFMALAFFIPEFRTIEILLFAWLLGSSISFLGFCCIARNWPWAETRPTKKLIPWVLEIFQESRIMYFNGIVSNLATYLDRYVITLFLGLEVTGVYIFFWQISSALGNLVQTGVLQVARPQLVRSFKLKEGNILELFSKCFKNTTVVTLPLAIIAGISVYFLLPYIDRPLAMQWYPIVWFVLGGFTLAMLGGVCSLLFYSNHRDDLIFKLGIFYFLISLSMNLIFIPYLGLYGAGIAMILSGIGNLGLSMYFIKKMGYLHPSFYQKEQV